MSSLDYCCEILQERLKNQSFQLWRHNDYTNKTTLVYGDARSDQAPIFPEISLSRPTHRTKKTEKGYILFLLYPEGYQMAIYTFQKDSPAFNKRQIKETYYLLYVLILEKMIRRKNIELNTIIDGMHSITTIAHLNKVLENILKNALKVISASDAGYLLLYDAEEDRLVPQAHVGFTDDIFNFKPKIGESITGTVFKEGKGRIFNSRKALFKQMDNLSITHQNLDIINISEPIVEGAICVPIKIYEETIGVIIVHQRKLKRKLTHHDLYLLEAFAGQAGIAIQNAKFHTETTERLDEITALSNELQRRNDTLRQRHEIHERLTMASIKNKGISVLISELDKMTPQPLIFFNNLEHSFHVPYKSEEEVPFTMFEIKNIFNKRSHPVQAKVVNQEKVEQNFFLQPIFTSGVFLGSFILKIEENVSLTDRITLEQGGTALALELVNRKTSISNQQQQMYEQFQTLIESNDPLNLIEYGEEIGLSIDAHWAIVILEVPQMLANNEQLDFNVYQISSQIEKNFKQMEKVVYSFNNEIVVLISLNDPADTDVIFNKISTIIDSYEDANIHAGLSNAYEGISHLKTCFEEAKKAIAYLYNHNKYGLTKYNDIGLNRLFVNQSNSEIDKFINEVFAPLRTNNERHRELEETLMAYIEHNRSANETAKILHIHINTMYQRIKTIEQLLQVDLNDSEDNLEIQLACHLQKTRNL